MKSFENVVTNHLKFYEDEVARNPYSLKSWLNILMFLDGSINRNYRFEVYERALIFLPRSYKLWKAYLKERNANLHGKPLNHKSYIFLVDAYERAIVHLHKMPLIWLDYCKLLISMKRGTDTRKAFDRALQSLPITQHKDLWVLYIEWVKEFGVPETAVKVFRRYIMFDPFQREQFVNYLEEIEEFSEAASQLTLCIEDANFTSKYGTSRHQLWIKLCDMFAYHPECVPNEFKVESIIRSGIARFSDEVGRLWCRLADYYVRQGLFEKARDIFEEALSSVTTVKDFSVIFDAYIKIEESVLSAKLRLMNEDASDGNEVEESGDVDMRLARLEYLMDKRPILLNSVVLRQNPNNVFEWHKRIKLFKDDTKRLLQAYTEAISTINPSLANGKFSSIWLSFSKHYEAEGDIESARTIFLKATKVDFKSVDELANVWCGWAEMEIRLKNYNKALEVLQNAVSEPSALVKRRRGLVDNTSSDDITSSLHKIHRNVKVWSFYLDLEESLGTFETCCAAYERAFDLKVVTVQMALNYATYLDEKNYFEESFKVYEKALALFTFPQLKVIWLTYLNKFINRYGGSKLERLRDLFEQCVSVVPSEDAAEFYVQYAKAEETYGLSRHAMNILDRATRIVPASQQLQMYRLYAKKVEQYFGVTKSRPIYERAVAELSDEDSKTLCLEFADIERKLGEVDRARAIFQHGSQFADPRRDLNYWNQWREFEEAHGNEDTFRDMLRMRRSVEAAFSQVNYLAAEMLAGEELAYEPQKNIESLEIHAERAAAARINQS